MVVGGFQRLLPRGCTFGAGPRPAHTSAASMAPNADRKPQSHPMQRSVELSRSDTDLSSPELSPSDDDLVFEPIELISTYPEPLFAHAPNSLHSPLHASDPALIRVAELLCESFIPLEERRFFTPSPQLEYDDCTDEEATVLAVHHLVQKSGVPLDTFILAALIVQQLPEAFYTEWKRTLLRRIPECAFTGRSKELVIITALIVAQKFLHDEIYILTTWASLVCEYRDDIQRSNLDITERLILKHIDWEVSKIANTETIASLHAQVHDEAKDAWERYEQFLLYLEADDGDYYYTPPYDT